MHQSDNCPICMGLSINGSMTDGQFSAFLSRCRKELGIKQKHLDSVIFDDSWTYDLYINALYFGNKKFSITAIGSFSPEYGTWLWGWANHNFPLIAKSNSSKIKSLYETTGFKVFIDDGAKTNVYGANDLAAMSVHVLGADGILFNKDGSILYIAVCLDNYVAV